MCLEKKTLLFMYVDNYCGFVSESFNFDIKRRFRFDRRKNAICPCPEKIEGFPDNFFGEKISALTLLIGGNGAGKTTLIRLMIKWLCELASGKNPQERGAFVIRVGNHNKLIAFQNGTSWGINIAEGADLETVGCKEVQPMLRDISLAYYTDTMSDLELDELLTETQLKYLTDYSLLTRLSESLGCADYFQNQKEAMRRSQFVFQMELLLKSGQASSFPIHFMKFSSVQIGTSKCLDHLKRLGNDEVSDLIPILTDLGKAFAPEDNGPKMFIRCLLWGFLAGIISSILQWEMQLFGNQQSHLVRFFREAFTECIRMVNNDSSDIYNSINDFFENLVPYVTTPPGSYFEKKFNMFWEPQLKEVALQYIALLKEAEKRYDSQNTPFNWKYRSTNDRIVYYIDLKVLPIEQWKRFWMLYKKIHYIVADYHFDWQYASSGEKNLANFGVPLYGTIGDDSLKKKHHLWLFLDEPDNTLHPRQKREFINHIYEEYNKSSNRYDNCQLWISTHSPIMLSDVTRQVAILICKENNRKTQKQLARSPFAQQIYTLFDDAFFMGNGIIGAFAEEKISALYEELSAMEKSLIRCEKYDADTARKQLSDAKAIINCLDEPLLKGYLLSAYQRCMSEANRRT